jgi:hypothetical protein
MEGFAVGVAADCGVTTNRKLLGVLETISPSR